MATLAFGLIGAAIGSSAGMATLGFTIGSLVGSLVMGLTQKNSAPDVQDGGVRSFDNLFQSSAYGAFIPIGYGTYRIAGNVIWASPIKEEIERVVVGEAGKGGLIGGKKKIYEDKHLYRISFAVAFGSIEGYRLEDAVYETTEESETGGEQIDITERKAFAGIMRLWFNSELMIDETTDRDEVDPQFEVTIHLGGDDSPQDPTITSYLPSNEVPAYRGILYIVVTDLELTEYGNAIPTITAEIYERLDRIDNLEEGCEGLCHDNDYNLWVCSHTKRVVQKVNPNNLEVIERVGRDTAPPGQYLGTLPAHPWRIAASPNGKYIWVTHKARSFITRISTLDNTFVSFPTYKFGIDITVDSTNHVWVTYPTESKVRKFDESGNVVAEVTINDAPWTCKYDPQRNAVWVGGNRSVHRIDIVTNTLVASINTKRYFHSDMGFCTYTSDIFVACSGDDQGAIIKATSNTLRRYRSTGTYPIGVDCNISDPWSTYYVSTYAGSRVRAFSRSLRGQFNAGTLSFPGQLVAYPDGTAFVANTKLGIVQRIRTR